MEEKGSNIWVALLRMRMHAWSFSLDTVAALWGTTEDFINEILVQNGWCPGVVRFAGKWAGGSKSVCNELKETMNKEFKKLEDYLSGTDKVEGKNNNPPPPPAT